MKKALLIGCGALMLILVVSVTFVGFRVYRGGVEISKNLDKAKSRVTELGRKYPFSPSEGATVTAERLRDWIGVQRGVADVHAAHKVEVVPDGYSARKTLSDIVESFRKLSSELPAQLNGAAEALDAAHMSIPEYGWIAGQVIAALKSPAAAKKTEFKVVIEKFNEGHFGEMATHLPQLADAQVDLVLKQLEPDIPVLVESLDAFEMLPLDLLDEFTPPRKNQAEDGK